MLDSDRAVCLLQIGPKEGVQPALRDFQPAIEVHAAHERLEEISCGWKAVGALV